MEITISELNGESCLALELQAPAKQQILCSQSFGEAVSDKHIMQQLITLLDRINTSTQLLNCIQI
jgi:DNA polymerase V